MRRSNMSAFLLCVLLCGLQVAAEEVTARGGKATQDGKTLQTGQPIAAPKDVGYDMFAFDVLDGRLKIAKKTFTAPSIKGKLYEFIRFKNLDPAQAPTNKLIDLILGNVTLDKGFSEGPKKIFVPLKFKDFADAGAFPLAADGNLKRPQGQGNNGTAQPPSSPDPLLWAAKVDIVDIDVDADRNGIIHDLDDDAEEEQWTKKRGAIFLLNNDNDGPNSVPDSWAGGDFDHRPNGRDEPEDTIIDDAEDVKDVTSFIVREPSIDKDKKDYTLWLRVKTEDLKKHVRIFPEKKAKTEYILGPNKWNTSAADKRIVNGDWTEQDITALVLGQGDQEMGLEGLTYRLKPEGWDGQVEIRLTLRHGSSDIGEDVVKLKVAPYILLSNLDDADIIYFPPRRDLKDAFDKINAKKPGGVSISFVRHRYLFDQDLFEIGYSSVPRTKITQKVLPEYLCVSHGLSLPLGIRDYFGPVKDADPYKGLKYALFAPQVKHYIDCFGGNIEILPPMTKWPMGRAVRVDLTRDPDTTFVDFFNAQELQGPVVEFNEEWLDVGHIDELISVVPTSDSSAPGDPRKFKIVMASPRVAWEILGNVPDKTAKVNKGRPGSSGVVWEYTVNDILKDKTAKKVNDWIQGRVDEIRKKLATEFGFRYAPGNPAVSDIIEVPVLYIWDEVPRGGGRMEKVWKGTKVGDDCGRCLTPGVANMLVVKAKGKCVAFVPKPNGPIVRGQDLFWKDIQTKFANGKISATLEKVETWVWHVSKGEVHCGTNARRKPKSDFLWWKRLK